jgi:hypothetical protein
MTMAAILLLVGCAEQTLVYNTQISPSYRPTEYGYGAGRRDFTTVVVGDPFGGAEQQFQEQFVALLNRHQPILQPTNFTLTPGPDARPIYRAVFFLDRAHAIPDRLCRDPASLPEVDLGSKVRVTAAFCRREAYLSTVTGEVEADSLDDPKFDSLIGQMILLLFPPVDPSRDSHPRWLIVDADEVEAAVRPSADLVAGG